MNYKKPENDSGSYVNGVYTSKNGFTGSGLNCPKGTRLYNTNVTCPIFFMSDDRGKNEDFEMVTRGFVQILCHIMLYVIMVDL